ncbi:hypothetical protein [Muricoccus aerilatus]|uniref:hypothetical protein n=1 Tax=Muricoccus aerilatus TaxID=452982 RepID=UPI0005C256B8|nr:hypothetical protein [Roseomonas aerilata]
MILNIIDRRGNPYRWKRIDVIAEPTWHDNSLAEGDQAPHDYREPGFATQKGVSLTDAVAWASSFAVPLTLYLYDEGSSAVPDG